MTILNASECQQAWNDLGLQTSIQDLETLFNQAGYTNDLNSIASNLEFQGGGFDSNGTALLTFKMTHWSEFLKKMHKLTGDATWMTRAEGLIDWFFDRTDAALWATDSAGHQNLPITGGGALIPYTQCAGLPLGWDVNTPWCGWSRIFTVNLSGTDTTFVRAEPLLDGGIANAILCQIKHMRECGVGASEAKVQSWLVKLECILSGWKANWEEGRSITINPDCNPSGTTVNLAGQFYLSSDQCGQTFADPIALNQAATMLSSMVLLNECDSSMCPDAKAMSALFIQDINNFYFNSAGGWYYRIGSCASFEPAEDMGHFYITAKFITTAFECGLVDQVFVDRFINGLKTNSYQSNGDWTWLNDGSYVTQGTQPNGSNTNGQGYASGPTDSAIGGASQLGKTIAAIAGLPGTSGCIPELSLTAQLLEGQGNLNNNEALEGLACLYVDACQEDTIVEPEPEPEPDCIDGTPASVSVGSGGCVDGIPLSVSVSGDDTCIEPGTEDTCIDPDNSGSNQIVTQTRYSPKDCNQVCCTDGGLDTAIVWCNWCTLKGSTVTATSAENGTDPRMTCECESGVYWQFVSRATYTVELDKEFSFDSVILSNHNLCEAGATIRILADGNPVKLMSHTNSEAIISVDDCDRHGFKCSCNDIAMYLPECKLASKVEIEIESDGLRKIGNITVGISTELTLEPNQSNPFDASHQIADFKTSGKCIYPPSIKDVGVEFDAVFTGLYSEYVDTELKPMFTYATRYPVHFAMSRTTLPNQVGRAIIRTRESSTFGNTPCKKSLTIPMTIFINGC